MSTKETKKSTETILSELEKKYGLEKASLTKRDIVSTGSYSLNNATNTGGYPKGKLIELYGPESSGKSTIVLHAITEFQRADPDRVAVLVDYEYSFDAAYAEALGVDVHKLRIYQPDSQENGYDMILSLVEAGICSLIVIDSHTAAIPKKIIDGDMSEATMAMQARNNSKFLGKIKGLLDKNGTTMLAVSQTRANIGSMHGESLIPTGGNAWKFYADMRFKIWKKLDKEDGSNRTTVDVIKNKCGNPFGKAEFDIVWGEGIDNIQEILDMAVDKKIVEQKGSWFSYGEMKLGQGSGKVKDLLLDNPEMFDEIKTQVLTK